MFGRHQVSERRQCRLHSLLFVKELDHQWQVRADTQQIRGMHHATGTKARDTTKYRDAMHAMLVMQDSHDLAHQSVLFPMIRFTQIDPHHQHVFCHDAHLSRSDVARDIRAQQCSQQPEKHGQAQIQNRVRGLTLFEQ
jgi:hypothetical protein